MTSCEGVKPPLTRCCCRRTVCLTGVEEQEVEICAVEYEPRVHQVMAMTMTKWITVTLTKLMTIMTKLMAIMTKLMTIMTKLMTMRK